MLGTQKKIISLAIASIIFVPFLLTNSFGEEPPSDYSFWQVVYLTNASRCIIDDEQKVKQYSEFVSKYFELYEFDNYSFKPKCMTATEYSSYNPPYSVDLVILVLDNADKNNVLEMNGYEGLYAHFGDNRMNNHVIMISEPGKFDSAYESSTMGWNTSHQLSHFILSFKGYNSESIERLLHFNSVNFDDCAETLQYSNCNLVKDVVKSELTGKEFDVMAPLEEAIGESLGKYIPENVINSKIIQNLHREITTWWLDEKIDDTSYLVATKHIVDVPITEDSKLSKPILKIKNGFAILEDASDNNVRAESGKFYAYGDESTGIHEILEYIPFNTEFLNTDKKSSEIPSWFKVRAKNWSEGKLGDKIFYDGLEALLRDGLLTEK